MWGEERDGLPKRLADREEVTEEKGNVKNNRKFVAE